MKTGAKFFYKNKDYESANNSLIIKYESARVDQIWQVAEKKYDTLLEKYKGASFAKKHHLKRLIPLTALYLTLREDSVDDCTEIISDLIKAQAIQERKKISADTDKNPFLFIKLLKIKLKFYFRPASGFSLHFLPAQKNKILFEEEESLYNSFCTEEACPELSSLFYKFIEYKYSGLAKIDFKIKLGEKSEFLFAVRDKDLWPESVS